MGKIDKKRHCPALEKVIDSADCGANRNSSYACPVDCSYNPFNPDNYEQLLEIEDTVDNSLFKHGVSHPYFKRLLNKAYRENEEDLFKLTGSFMHILYNETDDSGLTIRNHWEKDGHKGLKNDHKALLDYKNSIRLTVIEIQQVLDSETVVAVDSLDENQQPLKLLDRSLASKACRFQSLFGFVYKTPGFNRIHGTANTIPDIPGFTAAETVREVVEHLGGRLSQSWLMANTGKIADVLYATSVERHRQFLLNSEIQAVDVEYSLSNSPAKAADLLLEAGLYEGDLDLKSARDGVTHIFEALQFDRASESDQEAGNAKVLGTIRLYSDRVGLFATNGEAMAHTRRIFETALGPAVKFSKETIQDVSRQVAGHEPQPDSSLLPPRLLEEPGKVNFSAAYTEKPAEGASGADSVDAYLISHYKNLLDRGIPDLENLTPRQAAGDPGMRPKLILWAKRMINNNDRLNLEKGTSLDLNWILVDLGLEEINFSAPPERPRPEGREPDAMEEHEDYEDELEHSEVERYLRMFDDWLTTLDVPEDAYREMIFSGCNLMEMFTDEVGYLLCEKSTTICKSLFPLIWYAYADEFDPVKLKSGSISNFLSEFHCNVEEIMEDESLGLEDAFFEVCDDPELFVALGDFTMSHPNLAKLKASLSKDEAAKLTIALIVAVNALWDETMRIHP